MTVIVCFSDGQGNTDLDPPLAPVVIKEVTTQADGEGDTTVQVLYERVAMATVVEER